MGLPWDQLLEAGIKAMLSSKNVMGEMEISEEIIENTPIRVRDAYLELFSGYQMEPKEILAKSFPVDRTEMILIKNIPFVSCCEHHLMPFWGHAHFGYLPSKGVVGLSKIPRLIECFAKRIQLQERLGNQIVDAFHEIVSPKGCGIVIESTHSCMSLRGIRSVGAITCTHSLAGSFQDNQSVKSEFFGSLK